MDKTSFDGKMSMLVTEKRLLETSYKRTKDEEVQLEIKRRIIHIRSEMQKLKKEYNENPNTLEEIEGIEWVIKMNYLIYNLESKF